MTPPTRSPPQGGVGALGVAVLSPLCHPAAPGGPADPSRQRERWQRPWVDHATGTAPAWGITGAQPLGEVPPPGPLTPAGPLVALLGQGGTLHVPCAQAQPQSTNHGFSAPQH